MVLDHEIAGAAEASLQAIVPSDYTLSPQRAIAGKTFDAWSAAWWRWVLRIPADRNPLNDTTGAFCKEGQAGEVWFLAAGAAPGTTLACTIPAGKYLYFPIVTAVWVATEDWETFPMARAAANQWIDRMTAISTTLNGVALTRLRSRRSESVRFTVLFPFNKLWGISALPAGCSLVAAGYSCPDSVTNGDWVMLKPLPAGQYTLRIQGRVSSSVFRWPSLTDQTLNAFSINTTFNPQVQ